MIPSPDKIENDMPFGREMPVGREMPAARYALRA